MSYCLWLIANNKFHVGAFGALNYNTTNLFAGALDCTEPNIVLGQCLGGNWWSDYQGEDQDNDSIGDTAYTSGMISDPLPLVIPANPAVYPNAPELTTAINISQTTEGILEEPLQDEQNQSLPETTTDEDEPVQSTEQIEIPQTSQQSSGASAAAGGGGGGGGAGRAGKKNTPANN